MLKIHIKALHAALIALALVLLAVLIVFLLVDSRVDSSPCPEAGGLLNPRLNCDTSPVISKVSYHLFKKDLEQDIERMVEEGRVDVVGVYFRDLEYGPDFGINDREPFIPASLLKLPIMFAYFDLAEENPELLEKTLIFSSQSVELELPQTMPDELVLEQDKPYTVDELILRMIVYSDNYSTRLLEAYAPTLSPGNNPIQETYYDLGLLDPTDHTPGDAITVKQYASLFRLLYNTSYLTRELSEKALDYLAKAEFKEGLEQGVPEGIVVAHKFGERLGEDFMQLHDCGIVYYPNNPYLLCVMTRGDDYPELQAVIGEISKTVWDEVSSRQL